MSESVVAIDRPSTEDAHTLVDTNDSVTVGETDEDFVHRKKKSPGARSLQGAGVVTLA